MPMKPMLQQTWETGELIDQLAATRQAFGYTKLTEPTPPLTNASLPTASTSHQLADILSKKPEPRTIQQIYIYIQNYENARRQVNLY